MFENLFQVEALEPLWVPNKPGSHLYDCSFSETRQLSCVNSLPLKPVGVLESIPTEFNHSLTRMTASVRLGRKEEGGEVCRSFISLKLYCPMAS